MPAFVTIKEAILAIVAVAAFLLAIRKDRGESKEKQEEKQKAAAMERQQWLERFIKVETKQQLIEQYILKNIVVGFHSNPNPDTDKIIEKVLADEPLRPNEKEQLVKKMEAAAENVSETKKKLEVQAKAEFVKRLFEIEELELSISETGTRYLEE